MAVKKKRKKDALRDMAKMLSKVFEQRQFLRSPEIMEARRLLAKVNDLTPLGAGRIPGPDLPGSTPDERAASLLAPTVAAETLAESSSGAVGATVESSDS